jgi:hypothetical protein
MDVESITATDEETIYAQSEAVGSLDGSNPLLSAT